MIDQPPLRFRCEVCELDHANRPRESVITEDQAEVAYLKRSTVHHYCQ